MTFTDSFGLGTDVVNINRRLNTSRTNRRQDLSLDGSEKTCKPQFQEKLTLIY